MAYNFLKKHILFALLLMSLYANLSFSQTNSDKETTNVSGFNDDLNAEQIIGKYTSASISIWYTDKNYNSTS